MNLLPILFGGEQSVRNAVVVHMTEVKPQPEQDGARRGSWMGRGGFAVRSADWYYINNDSRPNELYEMRHDPWQRINVIDRYPEVANELEDEAREWAQRMKQSARSSLPEP